jgi:hypothetical protein
MANRSHLAGWLLASAVLTSSCYLGLCRGSLADVGQRCPQSFDGTPAGSPSCQPFNSDSEHAEIRICKDLIGLSSGPGLGGGGCYYDRTTHQLVGAYEFGDRLFYCERSSFDRSAGHRPGPDACPKEPTYVLECRSR